MPKISRPPCPLPIAEKAETNLRFMSNGGRELSLSIFWKDRTILNMYDHNQIDSMTF